MNQTFRVVFNRARGALMVVNEVTSSVQKKGTKTMVAVAAAALLAGVAVAGDTEGEVKDVTVNSDAPSADVVVQVDSQAKDPANTLIASTGTSATISQAAYKTGSATSKVSYDEKTGITVSGGEFKDFAFEEGLKASDGKYLGALMTVSGGKATVDGVTFTNNKVPGTHGLILADVADKNDMSLTVKNSTFTGNSTANGVIESTNHGTKTLAVSGSTFKGNTAKYHGGAIRANGVSELTVSDSRFENNTAALQSGAVHLTAVGNAKITNSEFIGNVANRPKADNGTETSGGGALSISADTKTVSVSDSKFEGNKAPTSHGGAIDIRVGADTNVTIANSAFTGNSASQGGAIYVWGDGQETEKTELVITDTDFTGNTAGAWGGAIAVNNKASVTIEAKDKDVTFSGNKSGQLTSEGAGARYLMTGDAIYINGGSDVTFNAGEGRTINIQDSIAANGAGAEINKIGEGKVVAGDMTGFVGALNVNGGSMEIAGGIGEYDIATQYQVNAATSKDAEVTAGSVVTAVKVEKDAKLSMGDVVINRSVTIDGTQSAGTTFTVAEGGSLTLNSLSVTTRKYEDKVVAEGETAATLTTSGKGSLNGNVIVNNRVDVQTGTSLDVAGQLTVGSIATGAAVKEAEGVKAQAAGTISGTGDIVVTGNAVSDNAGVLAVNSLTLNGGVFKTKASADNFKVGTVTVNAGSSLQFTELNSNEYLSYDDHQAEGDATYPKNQFLLTGNMILDGGKLLQADGSDLANLKIGRRDVNASVVVNSGSYKFDAVHFGGALENSQVNPSLTVEGGDVTVKKLYAETGVTQVAEGSLTVTELLRTAGTTSLVNEDSLTVTAGAIGLSINDKDDTAVWKDTESVGFKGLTNDGKLAINGLTGEVADTFFDQFATKFAGGGLVDVGDSVTVKGLKADEKTGEFTYADISKYNGIVLSQLENATVNTVTANADIKGSYGNLKMVKDVDSLTVNGILQLNGSGQLVADASGQNAVSVVLGDGDTLLTTGADAVIGAIQKDGTGEDATAGTLGVMSGKLTVAETKATEDTPAGYNSIAVNDLYVANGAELSALGDVTVDDYVEVLGKATIGTLTAGEVYVGSDAQDGAPSVAGELIVQHLASGTIFADPAWDANGQLALDNLSRVAVGTFGDGATAIAGQASLVAVGTTDLAAATAAVRNAGYNYLGTSEGQMKSVVYVENTKDDAGNYVSVAGNVFATGWTEAEYEESSKTENALTGVKVLENNLMVVNMDAVDTTGTTAVFTQAVNNEGTIYLANAELNDKIKATYSGTGKVLFDGDRLMSLTATEVADTYSLGFDDAKVSALGNLHTLGLVQEMYKDGAQRGSAKSAVFNNWLMNSNNGLSTGEVVRAGNDVAAIGATAGMASVTLDAMSAFNDTVATRTNILAARGEGVNVWADVNGGRYSAKKLMNGAGYASDIYAGVLGVDTQFAGTVVGAALTVGTGNTDSKNTSAETSMDSDFFGLSVYASHKFGDIFNVAADFGYMQGSNDVSANYNLGSFSADTDAFTFGVRGELLTEVAGFNLVPHVGLRWTQISTDSFEAGYVTDIDDMNVFQMPVGITVKGDVEVAGWTASPMFDLSFVPTFGDKNADMTLGIAGVKATDDLAVRVVDSNPVQATLGVNAVNGAWSFGLDYKLGVGSNERMNNTFNARLNYAF